MNQTEEDGAFGYAKYSQPIGFKREFGNAYDEHDVEMGRSINQDHSDDSAHLQLGRMSVRFCIAERTN